MRRSPSLASLALKLHRRHHGKIALAVKTPVRTRTDLSLFYTPGVAAVSQAIVRSPKLANTYTARGNWVAVVSDGSAVLGLGNVGPAAALPIMEGKAILFKELAGIDAFPLVLNTQDPDQIIAAVVAIAPSFGGINLEDISAPNCFYIESELKKRLKIPVMHDDQHGTAIVVLAGLINSLKLTGRNFRTTSFVISGAGAAGTAVARMLHRVGVQKLIVVDSHGIISRYRQDLNSSKQTLLPLTNPQNLRGDLAHTLKGADVFIGVSRGNLVNPNMIKSMAPHPIIFAMANPVPEIDPQVARQAGGAIVATGRSDYPNQVNNVLAFPGVFRGALDAHASQITEKMKLAAATALAKCIPHPTPTQILPKPLDKKVVPAIARAVRVATLPGSTHP